MAQLLVEHNGQRSIVTFGTRVTIGSSPANRVIIDTKGILPDHGVITCEGDMYRFIPSGEGAVVYINGEAVRGERPLSLTDRIDVGSAVLALLANEKTEGLRGVPKSREGVKLRCSCGASLRVRSANHGSHVKCPRCLQKIFLNRDSREVTTKAATFEGATEVPGDAGRSQCAVVTEICSICQSMLEASEEFATCTACRLNYHRECWEENLGCAAYGCSNVNALKRSPDIRVAEAVLNGSLSGSSLPVSAGATPAVSSQRLPWEFPLLAASVLAAVLSAVTFGLPSLAVAALAVLFANSSEHPHIPILILVWLVSGIGLLVGAEVSVYLWLA